MSIVIVSDRDVNQNADPCIRKYYLTSIREQLLHILAT